MRPTFSSRRGLLLFCVVSALAGLPQARAELVWKQRSVELRADAASTVLEARFPFTNTGTTPVDITQVQSSCGCTVVSLDKRHYEAHESGEIVAKYTVGAQTGLQKKTVQVETNQGGEPTVLTLNIHLPEILSIHPPFVIWNHGEAPTPKTISLEVLQDLPANDLTVQSNAVGFAVEVRPVTPGRKYELTVRPQNTDHHQFSTLVIHCRFGGEGKIFRAYANVRTTETHD